MAKSPRQTVFDGMEILPKGLQPFVLRQLQAALGRGQGLGAKVHTRFPHWRREWAQRGNVTLDTQKLLHLINGFWDEAFRKALDRTHRSIVNELIDVRNRLAHDGLFSHDDAERALDSMRRLLRAAGANALAEEIDKMRDSVLREKYSESPPPEGRKGTPGSSPCPASGHTRGCHDGKSPAPQARASGTIYERILAYVREHPGSRQIEIAKGIFGRTATQQRVNQDIRLAVNRGDLIQGGFGGPGDPYRYSLPKGHSPDPAPKGGGGLQPGQIRPVDRLP